MPAKPEIPAERELFRISGIMLMMIVCSSFWRLVRNEAEERRWGGGD